MTGKEFEHEVQSFFVRRGVELAGSFSAAVGFGKRVKKRHFDLGSVKPPVLVECKCHTWTKSGNTPEAKLAIWNEAMLYFAAAPKRFRKILCVRRSVLDDWSLAQEYVERYGHLIPKGTELWEYNPSTKRGRCVFVGK